MKAKTDADSAYKDTLNLPRTGFPMRASLTEREPARLEQWQQADLYGRIQQRRQGAPKYILHDGPPFANGDVHMGTALNKVLKDLVLKSKTMAGFHCPFVPGWDCHGLPIEFKVVKESAGLEPAEIRRRSEAFARKFIGIQKQSFQRLGVFADWDHPYLTLDPAYEADIIRTFATCVDQGLVYQSRKPVLWSYGAQTALAEAEVEYKEKKSTAVFAAFPLRLGTDLPPPPELSGHALVIWTTTPWTLPANSGIALHPRFDYLAATFRHDDGRELKLVLAKARLEAFTAATGFAPLPADQQPQHEFKGADLAGLLADHPFLDRTSKVIIAEFVTDESGTGAVHIAPGHGADDYVAGQQHGLELRSPVDDNGLYTAECGLPDLVGQLVFDCDVPIIKLLHARGALVGKERHPHSYPHCWRSKTPIIFRAVEQFFIRIDSIRQQALEAIDQVHWIPPWGRNRIYGTVESRPDWCISRQRTWGVPLPVFYRPDGSPIVDGDLARRVADVVAGHEHGTNLWFEEDDAAWAVRLGLPEGTTRCRDTLDVWIDSGCSHVAVLDAHPELHAPCDLYLEATDQHRGWFQSSLMVSMITRGTAPYKAVLTHGFVIDNSTGEKLAKSGDKPINAEHFYNRYGADMVRLWVASVDYQNEVPFSDDLFQQTADSYRRIRNTLRILHGNLFDYEPTPQAADPASLTMIDRWILERLHELTRDCLAAYERLDFRKVFILLNQFCAVDLSALYVDITKDRLYCDAPGSARRRSTQQAMHQVLDHLVRLLAPVLVFTAEEMWAEMGHDESVHLQDFPQPDPAFAPGGSGVIPQVNRLLRLRELAQAAIEEAIQAKAIRKRNEAMVRFDVAENDRFDRDHEIDHETLLETLMVSDAVLTPSGAEASVATVEPTAHQRCPRCWRHLPDVGSRSGHADVCGRCADALDATGHVADAAPVG